MHLQLFLHQCQKPSAPPGQCLSLLLVDPYILVLSQPLNLLSHNVHLQKNFEVPHLSVLPQTLPWETYKLLQRARSQPWL